jgi:hypothetical protein
MALFKLGQVVATPDALAHCERQNINPLLLLGRHIGGDWGDLGAEDVAANVHAIQHDERILSAYVLGGEKLYVITEWDRTLTTLLLASEY